jgi:hypothetical protein
MSRVISLVALALLAIVGVAAVQAAVVETGQQQSVDGEQFAPDPGNYIELENSNIDGATYDPTPVVRTANGQIVQEGDDYEWNRSDGTIKTIEGEALEGNTATIDYSWTQPSETQRNIAGLAGSSFEVVGLLILVLGVSLVLGMLGVVTRL